MAMEILFKYSNNQHMCGSFRTSGKKLLNFTKKCMNSTKRKNAAKALSSKK
jgi:hypothetical protein